MLGLAKTKDVSGEDELSLRVSRGEELFPCQFRIIVEQLSQRLHPHRYGQRYSYEHRVALSAILLAHPEHKVQKSKVALAVQFNPIVDQVLSNR